MKLRCLIGLSVVVALVAGACSSAPSGTNKQERSRLKPLVVLYTSAAAALHHPPQNEGEFKKYIATQKGKMLDVLNVQNPDELFTSERDGESYVVRYGPPANGKEAEVIAYEKTGVDGKRMVGYATGIVVELDDEHFREAVPH